MINAPEASVSFLQCCVTQFNYTLPCFREDSGHRTREYKKDKIAEIRNKISFKEREIALPVDTENLAGWQ